MVMRWAHVIFVDDTYLLHSPMDPVAPYDRIVEIVENDVNLWSKWIYTKGGKLEGLKKKYHVARWKFLPDGSPFITSENQGERSVMLNTGDGRMKLKQIDHDKGDQQFKSLGTRISGDLANEFEYEEVMCKVN